MAKKSFEEALENLEKIVQRLEDSDLALEEALRLFEEGVKLSRLCSQKLDEAEKKVEILLQNQEGELDRQPFENLPEKDETI